MKLENSTQSDLCNPYSTSIIIENLLLPRPQCLHYAGETWKLNNDRSFWRKLGQGNRMINVVFKKFRFKVFSVHNKTQGRRFQIKCFRKAAFSWRISVDGRPNHKIKAFLFKFPPRDVDGAWVYIDDNAKKKKLTSPILEISWEVSLIFKPPSFIFCCTKFWIFSTRSSSALHLFSAFSASGPVSATILRIPLEMASSDTSTNDFMCPVRCRCLVWMIQRTETFYPSLFVLRFIAYCWFKRNMNYPITKALFSQPIWC